MKKLITFSLLSLVSIFTFSQSLSELFEKVNPSVATIYVIERINPGTGDPYLKTSNEGMGSGVLVDKDLVLTATHVVNNATKIMVEFPGGQKVTAKNFRAIATADVALLKLDRSIADIEPAQLGNSDEVKIGDEIFIIGAPLGLTHSLSKGIISGRRSEKNLTNNMNRMEFFQTDAAINQGNSGGPMFNMEGKVVGIVSSILSFSGGFEGLGFAASSNIAYSLLTKKGSVWFGLDAIMLDYNLCKTFNVPQQGAILIQHVAENSPSDFMGLKGGFISMSIGENTFLAGGDIILAFDGIEMESEAAIETLRDHLNDVEPNHQYKIKILRHGEIKELKWRMPE